MLATKKSDSETTAKGMPDAATTLKAMAKSNDPKVREAAALMATLEPTKKSDSKGTQNPAQVRKRVRRRSLSRDVMDPGRVASPARVGEEEERWMRHGVGLTADEAWS